ncbi:MAG: WD40/YVTN/BNR-like repeat-containing protein [Vicinamibacterales bacterium]
MNADRDRDRLLDEALKHQLGARRNIPASSECLDAETMAAWMEGGLDAESMAMAETHAAGCGRCQAMLGAMGRTAPAPPVAATQGARLWRWWFAPLAATAAAVTLWMVVPQEPAMMPASMPAAEVAQAEPESPPAPSPASQAAPAPPLPPAAKERANAAPPTRAETGQRERQPFSAPEAKAEAPRLADTAAEGRVAAAPPAAALRRQTEVPDEAKITARSSPSPAIIWAVGPQGMVLLATDGRTFARVPFPEIVDLTAVMARDEHNAIVTAGDGRTFQTEDGGRTWKRP